jgi:hypothetical protein
MTINRNISGDLDILVSLWDIATRNQSINCNIIPIFQFAMLSGQAPFYSRTKVDTANTVMRKIKEGDFRLEGEAWR